MTNVRLNSRVIFQKTAGSALSLLMAATGVGHAENLGDHPSLRLAGEMSEMWVDFQVESRNIPGLSIAVVQDQNTIWSKAFGYSDIEKKIPSSTDTIYSGCSIAKVFTATAAMRLRDEGHFDLDTDVKGLLPWLEFKSEKPSGGPITVRSLLAHFAGMPDDLEATYWSDQKFPGAEEFRQQLKNTDAAFPVGERYYYSNVGIALAGEVVSAVSGQSIGDYVQASIFEPLGMKDSSLDIPVAKAGGQLATGYQGLGRGGTRTPFRSYQVNGLSAAAGIATTVNDMAKFISWQFRDAQGDDPVLRSSTKNEMYRVEWYDGEEPAMGLGYNVLHFGGHRFIGKDGGCPGFNSAMMFEPKVKLGAVVMINTNDLDPWIIDRGVFSLFQPALMEAMSGGNAENAPDKKLKKYAGVYRLFHLETGIFVHGKELVALSLNDNEPASGMRILKPAGPNRFARLMPDGSLDRYVTFKADDKGNMTTMEEVGAAWARVDE